MKSIIDKLQSAVLYFNNELLKGVIIDTPEVSDPIKDLSLTSLVERAHKEWVQAKCFFDEVNDPELIDHAIYAMEAAERKYIYLLKLAQKEQHIDESLIQRNSNEDELA